MNILIIPDKFKGSLSASEAADFIETGIMESGLSASMEKIPLADGGEGTAALLTQAHKACMRSAKTVDPLWREIIANYGFMEAEKKAFLDMASASGLGLLAPLERNPLVTTSFGTGRLLAACLEAGAQEIVLGIGGSATNDGGIGLAQALGVHFLDRNGNTILPVGGKLLEIAHIELRGSVPVYDQVKLTTLTDVNNKLFGPDGAARIFGPQKGGSPDMIDHLDAGLAHLAGLIKRLFGIEVNIPGAGAGGGLLASLMLLFHCKTQSGVDYVINTLEVEKKITQADLIITGEGKLDRQTLLGKAVFGIAQRCLRHQKKLWIVAGSVALTPQEQATLHAEKIIEICAHDVKLEECLVNAGYYLREKIKFACLDL